MHHKEYPNKSVGFVCDENHEYAVWLAVEQPYVMGIASIWNSENFKQVTASVDDDDIWEQIENIAEDWVVRKVKDFSKLVVGEKWGFLSARDIELPQ